VTVDRLRIGTLGAARITPGALIKPARQIPEVTVAAVAARDPERARRFAAKHRIRRVHDSYQQLIDDPAIDAVYNPLPNSLHARWTLRAIEAGKHVLCEKPFTANAAEAAEVAAAAAATGLVVMEAFHYRYHPLARRMREVVGSG
jgi:predicted dehydrogenase